MSRFLANKKYLALSMTALAITMLLVMRLWWLATLTVIIALLLSLLNRIVRQFIYSPMSKLSSNREICHLENIVIGAQVSRIYLKKRYGENSLIITSPHRSLSTSLLLLKHLGSCMGSGGTVHFIIPHKKTIRLSMFDIPYLSPLTKLEMHISTKRFEYMLPLLFHPISSLNMLLGELFCKTMKEVEFFDQEIEEYCKRKGFLVKYHTC